MNSTEWNRIKNIRQSKGVMAHVSKTFSPFQLSPQDPIRYLPNLGVTADFGRNKAKREARANGLRHIGKAKRVSE